MSNNNISRNSPSTNLNFRRAAEGEDARDVEAGRTVHEEEAPADNEHQSLGSRIINALSGTGSAWVAGGAAVATTYPLAIAARLTQAEQEKPIHDMDRLINRVVLPATAMTIGVATTLLALRVQRLKRQLDQMQTQRPND